jgi:hypothetical protein
MSTLLISAPSASAERPAATLPVLRTWLEGDWALLFSHPGDFVRCELEIDRWLSVMQRTFASARIRPLELSAPAEAALGRSWIRELSGDAGTISLFDTGEPYSNARDLQAYALREEISALGRRRFVMIIDDTLRNRRTFAYSALAEVPSPLEFVGWAAAARAKSAASAWAAQRRVGARPLDRAAFGSLVAR